MSLSAGLLLALLVLAPGFALHAAIYRFRSKTGIGSAPPPPGSVVALSVIGFGALAVHSVWAVLSAANDAVCGHVGCLAVAFQPNIYSAIFAAGAGNLEIGSNDAAWLLAATLILTLVTYVLAGMFATSGYGRRQLRGLQYGWLCDLVELAEADGRFTTAFVVTNAQHEGVVLGYEGLLENLTVNAEKEITSVTLLDVSRFTLSVADARRSDVLGKPIPRLYLHRASIQNIAFNVFEYLDEGGTGQAPQESLPAVHGNP